MWLSGKILYTDSNQPNGFAIAVIERLAFHKPGTHPIAFDGALRLHLWERF
jgi:hypothetical protein